ncbi:MAG TPA: DUF2935 domain-containing protein [Acetivibrio sp.]|uniref:DUF2935 domain-containing protein n=1 Tax=Acetivibrio sp. TaxID=1872092 RepID=UPI002C6392A4|nr:DUF2935 domain-containing protein [Acetivibrio sp.]HOM02428.1 DUF2935 domain-containing protein [Acetivibrio sp.]
MQFCYGDKNHIRILEEAGFWKRQEAEHTVVIRKIIPDLEERFVEKLDEYQKILGSTEAIILQYIERLNRSGCIITPELAQRIANIIEITLCQSQTFVNFLNAMAKESAVVANNFTASVVINHIIRESEYYMGIAKAYLDRIALR